MPEIAYLNGSFCAIHEAKVSIEDRGFQFADGVYEVVVFHGERPVMLAEHMRRLHNSCNEIALQVDFERLDLESISAEGVRRAGFDHTMVYLQLTRGVAPRNHLFPVRSEPTVVMTFKPKPIIPAEKRNKGLRLVTMQDFRWSRCHIKSIALLPNVLARNEALARGYDDALFIGPAGEIHEASASNVFMIQQRSLLTPPQDHTILPGITRQLVLRCAHALELPVREERLTLEDVKGMDEIFVCSTTVDILGVVELDDHSIASGKPGRLTQSLYKQMQIEVGITGQ